MPQIVSHFLFNENESRSLSLSLFFSRNPRIQVAIDFRLLEKVKLKLGGGKQNTKKKTIEKLWKTKQTCNCPNINKWLGPTALASLRQICLLSVLRIHYPSYIKWSCCGLIPSRLGSAPPHPQLVSEVRTW